MNLILEGTVKTVLPLQSGISKAGNEWKKQEFVIETTEQYPKAVKFTLFGDKVDNFGVFLLEGNQVTVHFDAESREFNGKYYTDLNAYKVEPIGDTIGNSHAEMDKMADSYLNNQPDPSHHGAPEPNEDLPF